jgi:hypothetical protein
VLDSFIRLGLTQEVQGTLAWMLSCIAATAPVIHPFYGLRGHVPDEETDCRIWHCSTRPPCWTSSRAADPGSAGAAHTLATASAP